MITWIIALSLVSWRITSLLHTESMFDWLRKLVGIEQDDSNDTYNWLYPDNIFGHMLECFWCLSFWLTWALSLGLAYYVKYTVVEWIVLWLASATGTIIVEKWIGRSKARW